MTTMFLLAATLIGCSPASPPPAAPRACDVIAAHAPGPLFESRRATDDAFTIARLHVEEARRTGDQGFYELARSALSCAVEREPGDPRASRLQAHVELQFHRFSEVERVARGLVDAHGTWLDWALLGDALMEQGDLDGAAEAYQRAVDLRPGLPMYDRIAWLRWLWGDVDGALDLQRRAVRSGTAADPEPLAWVLTRLGWMHALLGEPAPEIEHALRLVPDYPPARFARGRIRLHAGDPGAAEDLRVAGRTFEAVRALHEIDPTADPEALRDEDPRGYAIWIADRDPTTALRLLEAELLARRDAATRMAYAYALHAAGRDGANEARAALATGATEPRLLLQAGVVLNDRALVERALAMGPGLLPSERALAGRVSP